MGLFQCPRRNHLYVFVIIIAIIFSVSEDFVFASDIVFVYSRILLTRATTSEIFTSPLSSISPYFSTLAALSVEPKM